MIKKLIYIGIAAAFLFTTGFQSTKTFAVSPVTELKKSIEDIKSISSLSKKDSKFSKLDVHKIFNKTLKTGSSKLSTENNYIFEEEPNDFVELADPLPLGKAALGDLSFNYYRDGDFDLFKVKVTQPGYLFLGAKLNRVDYYTDFGFGLFDSSAQLVTPEYYDTEEGMDYQILPVYPGTYYIAAMNLYELASYDQYFLYADMLDTIPPDAPKVNPIADNDKIITGKAEANSTLAIRKGSTLFKTVQVSTSGSFKISLTTPFKAGTKLSFTAEDSSGNVSKETFVTVLDKTPPGAPKVNPIADNNKSISGKAEANSTITIKNGSKPFSTAKVDKYGNFKLSIKPLKAGTKLYFTATDQSKNVSKVTTVTVVDKTPPSTLTVSKIYRTSKYVSGKTEAKVAVIVKVGNKTISSGKSDSKGYYKLKIKSQKKNTILTITAKDSSGNSKTVKVKVR